LPFARPALLVEQTGQVFHLGAQVGDLTFEAETVSAGAQNRFSRTLGDAACRGASWRS
jgi:hypothetical protein